MNATQFYIGLDVHKGSIAIAYAEAASRKEAPRFLGTTRYSVISLSKALTSLAPPEALDLCYGGRSLRLRSCSGTARAWLRL